MEWLKKMVCSRRFRFDFALLIHLALAIGMVVLGILRRGSGF